MKQKLEDLYLTYNTREFVDPDPLLFLYDYPDKKDREIAGMVASSLAYGQVALIMKAVSHVLVKMGPSLSDYLDTRTQKDMAYDFKDFVYRFAKQEHIVSFLWGTRNVVKTFGSVEACFCEGMIKPDALVWDALDFLYCRMECAGKTGHLMADPEKASACKRSHLFLRWMVRNDAVDPGGWDQICAASLMIPLDTHMHRIGQVLGFTQRKAADRKTVVEITTGFKKILPEDPVKYDFCLTRFGIRKSLDMDHLKKFFAQNQGKR